MVDSQGRAHKHRLMTDNHDKHDPHHIMSLFTAAGHQDWNASHADLFRIEMLKWTLKIVEVFRCSITPGRRRVDGHSGSPALPTLQSYIIFCCCLETWKLRAMSLCQCAFSLVTIGTPSGNIPTQSVTKVFAKTKQLQMGTYMGTTV